MCLCVSCVLYASPQTKYIQRSNFFEKSELAIKHYPKSISLLFSKCPLQKINHKDYRHHDFLSRYKYIYVPSASNCGNVLHSIM